MPGQIVCARRSAENSPMQAITKADFLRRFSEKKLVLDERYRPPQTLRFLENSELRWGSEIPSCPKTLPRFVTSLFEVCDENHSFYLFPRNGAWDSGDSLKLFQMNSIFTKLGFIPQSDEVLEMKVEEINAVESLFALSLVFGGTVSDDVFAIPSHGRVVLYADHHEAVHVEFHDRYFMKRFLAQLPEWDMG